MSVETFDIDKVLRFAELHKLEDSLVGLYHNGSWVFTTNKGIYPCVYIECELRVTEPFPKQDRELLCAEGAWRLTWDQYGYVQLDSLVDGALMARSRLPLGTYVEENCRLGILIVNPMWSKRKQPDASEGYDYCRTQILASRTLQSELRIISDMPLQNENQRVIPEVWRVPEDDMVVSLKIWNTSYWEYFDLQNDQGGPIVEADQSSRVYSRYNASHDVLTLFAGPEFVMPSSYWILSKISGAQADKTRLRMYMSRFNGMPNMAPVFFWSKDRVTWSKIKLLEPVNDAGEFVPLLLAPADDFYISTSFPFQEPERLAFLDWVRSQDAVCVKVIGQSLGGVDIHGVSVTDWSVPAERKKHLAFIVGQHSPQEIIAANFLRPMLEEILKDADFMHRAAVHFVSTVNVDCARWGSYGMNLANWNLNRCWIENPQPESECVKKWLLDIGQPIDAFIDFHAGGTWRNHTMLRISEKSYREYAGEHAGRVLEHEMKFASALETHCGFRLVDSMVTSRKDGAKDWVAVNFKMCASMTIELGTCTCFDPCLKQNVAVTQKNIKAIGRGLKEAFREYTH